jgi:hypothetical protein
MEIVRRSNVSGIAITLEQAADITALDFAYENQTSKAAYKRARCAYDIIAILVEATFLKEENPWPYCARKEGKI